MFNEVLEPHQQIRIKVLLGMEDDPTGAGYNVNQSKIAIGSGGFLGKGFLNGTQTKLKYVLNRILILFLYGRRRKRICRFYFRYSSVCFINMAFDLFG